MKAKITLLILLATIKISFAGKTADNAVNNDGNSLSKTSIINSGDTVVFDLSQTGFSANILDFPVYISTDDTINALDFSLRYNQQQFVYDTIINLTTNMQIMSYFNTSDSTLRFTSNSLHQISIDTPLVNIRFRLLSGQVCNIGLTDINAYLNGDVCSTRIVNCVVNSTQDLANPFVFNVYPNPTSDKLFVESTNGEHVKAGLFNAIGCKVAESETISNESCTIDVNELPAGMYILSVQSGQFIKKQTICIVH